MNLTPEQIAAARAIGVQFRRATPDQVHRLSMQRKVFRMDGEAVLATRDGSLFETTATLERLIAEGERQLSDLAQWEAAAPVPATEPVAAPEPLAQSVPVEATKARPARKRRAVTEPPEEPAPAVSALPNAPARTPRVRRGETWQTAGAERRGRLAQHWSVRRK